VLGGYVTIVNTGAQSDRLVGGRTAVAKTLKPPDGSLFFVRDGAIL
jgi:hypothetical protein